jgi:hypothetical protein
VIRRAVLAGTRVLVRRKLRKRNGHPLTEDARPNEALNQLLLLARGVELSLGHTQAGVPALGTLLRRRIHGS